MNKLQWGEGVVEEGFSRDDVYAASWEMPRSLPDKEHEWGVAIICTGWKARAEAGKWKEYSMFN